MTNQLEIYQNNAVNTASGPQLTLMLYNGCLKFTRMAMKAIEMKNYELKNTNVQKAQAIIRELMLTLDQGIAISQQLLPLYEYIYEQMQQGNIKNDRSLLGEALELTTELRDTWKEAMKKDAATYVQDVRV